MVWETGSSASNSAFDNDAIKDIEPVIIDTWSFLDYKVPFRMPQGHTAVMPTWADDHLRRLRAYTLYDAYYKQCARRWMKRSPTEDMEDRREYGDAYVITETAMASLLGNDQNVVVEGAISGENNDGPENKQQERLRQWVEDENALLKFTECERNAVKLGDGVYTLGWNSKKKRVILRVWDPGFYFPVDDPLNDEEFPNKVHIAYEFEEVDPNDKNQKLKKVRKITWELVDAEGGLSVPWEKEAPEKNCRYSDGVWTLSGEQQTGLDDFTAENAVWRQEPILLGLDYIPVIHIPNMNFSSTDEWGVPVMAPTMQLFDDLYSTDTDLQKSSALAGSPVLGVAEGMVDRNDKGEVVSYGPGSIFEGKLEFTDTSKNLDALLKLQDAQLKRLSVNSRIPETLLGRIDPGKVQSGVILTITLAPHTTLIREMRRIRRVKYRLLFKMVMRFMWKEDAQGISEIFATDLQMGSYLPADKTEVSGIVTAVLNAHGMSRETGIRMLLEAGYPIDDINEEIERIEHRDFAGAKDLFDATTDPDAVAEYLGIQISQESVSPQQELDHELELEEAKGEQARQTAKEVFKANQQAPGPGNPNRPNPASGQPARRP